MTREEEFDIHLTESDGMRMINALELADYSYSKLMNEDAVVRIQIANIRERIMKAMGNPSSVASVKSGPKPGLFCDGSSRKKQQIKKKKTHP